MRKPLIAVALCVLPLCACARLQSFRVVDAETGQPILGVQAERLADVGKSANAAHPEALSLPVELASTNVGGMATFNGSGQQFTLKKDGYERVQVRSTLSGVLIRYESTGQEVSAPSVEGVAHIPLRRMGAGSPTKTATPIAASAQPAAVPASRSTGMSQRSTSMSQSATTSAMR